MTETGVPAPDLRICTDCAIWAANADASGMSDERLEEVKRGIEALGGYLVPGEDDGFSMSPCGCCGSRLGGDRLTAWVI